MPSSCPISGCVTLGGAFPSRSLIFSSLNGQEYLRSQSSSRSCGLCPPLRGDEVRGGGGGGWGREAGQDRNQDPPERGTSTEGGWVELDASIVSTPGILRPALPEKAGVGERAGPLPGTSPQMVS